MDSPQFFDALYAELRSIARALMASQGPEALLQPTAVVHEAFLRMPEGGYAEGRVHFLATAAKVMRSVLIDEARARGSLKRGGGWRRIPLDLADGPAPPASVDILDLESALQQLAALDPRQARLVELRFFGGLTVPETARVLGVSERTVDLDWAMARAWLRLRLEGAAA